MVRQCGESDYYPAEPLSRFERVITRSRASTYTRTHARTQYVPKRHRRSRVYMPCVRHMYRGKRMRLIGAEIRVGARTYVHAHAHAYVQPRCTAFPLAPRIYICN